MEHEMKKYLAGIDPGLSGAICLYDPTPLPETKNMGAFEVSQRLLEKIIIFDMPTHEITKNGKKKRQLDLYEIGRFIDKHSADIEKAFIENPNAMPGQGVTSCFNFGFNCGAIQGIVAANFIAMDLVHPATWKRDMGLTKDKDACRRRASQLLPAYSGEWSRVKDDGRAEAALIALWGSKK